MKNNRIFEQDGYFHIYNRGNRKQDIFSEKEDYIFYLERLRKYKEQHKISVICYCLMPNHIHLFLRQDSNTPISKLMASLHTSYSMYFNNKYEKVGHLFQNAYQAKKVDRDEYLLYLTGYIHSNPVIDGLAKDPEGYQWSSYLDYIGARPGTLCDKEIVMSGVSANTYKSIIQGVISLRTVLKRANL